tara:strand:+ start:1568 stop:3244 length:1677 start_codon:yes stop_codon:yes gene_type:complete
MFNKQMSNLKIGYYQAIFNVMIFWGISNIWMSYSTQILGVSKIIFALATYTSCSLCLLLYAGHGKLSKETMRSVDTWAYGIIMLINYFVTLNLFSLTTATEASLIQRFSVVFSVLVSWFFLLRQPTKSQLIGLVMIFSGVIYIVNNSVEEKIFYLYLLMVLAGIFQSLRIFIAELHRPNKAANQDNSIKTRCRVVGYVMFVITLLFSGLIGTATYLHEFIPEAYKVNLVVSWEDFFSYKSILAGFVMGILIYTPIRYLEFSASEKIKTENYLTITAFSFISTFFWEWVTSPLTGLSLKTVTPEVALAGIIITAGALVMSISKILSPKDKKSNLELYLKADTQDLESIEETRDVIANTLEHFGSNVKKAAKALNIPANIITAVLEDKDKVLAFNEETLKKVARSYRKNVASSDSLTGLLNRTGFMSSLKAASYEADALSLFFIDLNKFKPVNDTYGHEAGDYVLKIIAKRLNELFPYKSLITRLGGDEYCILLLDINKAQAESKIKLITEQLEKEISYKDSMISISGSIGLASYPEDTKKAEDLIDIADKQMYVEKSER